MSFLSRKTADRLYRPQIPALMGPVGAESPLLYTASATFPAANQIRGVRAIVPFDGTITDFLVGVVTQSGNVRPVIYDTGDATPGSRTKLWDGGSIACPANADFRSLGNPGIPVRAGQNVDLGFQPDNAIAAFARLVTPIIAQPFPTGYLPVAGGARAKLMWGWAPGVGTAPATVAEATYGGAVNIAFGVWAIVTPTLP